MQRVHCLGPAVRAAYSRTQLPTTGAKHSTSSGTGSLWTNLRVAIIGCGVAGPTLALLLKKHLGCTPVIFDRVPEVKEVKYIRPSQLAIAATKHNTLVQSCLHISMYVLTVKARLDILSLLQQPRAQQAYSVPNYHSSSCTGCMSHSAKFTPSSHSRR